MDRQLKCGQDGKFHIMCLGDLHENAEIDTPLGKAKAADMAKLINAALDRFQPDLVVLMGDTCTDCTDNDPAVFRAVVTRVTQPMVDRRIPFAFIMGNHEHDHHHEDMIVKTYASIPGCLIFNDDPSITGCLNYYHTVFSSDGETPAFNLWFLDSNNLCEDQAVSMYDWVHEDQIAWYERKAQELKERYGRLLPAVLFQHIPVPEEYDAMRPMKPWELYQSVKGHAAWSSVRYVAKENMRGYLGEGPCAPCRNSGQFASWKKTGDILAAFFGHDHLNDFTCVVDGVTMGQCKTAGFRCYTDGCQTSVRMVTLDETAPDRIETEVYRFKQDFGLKSQSLGPIQRRINDKQSFVLNVAVRVAAGAAAAVVGAVAVKQLQKRLKQK